jgi:glucose/arabinose dehydrogenase/chitodextrinase
MRVRLPAALAACLLLLALTRSATALPPNFSDSLVVEVPAPTAVAFTPDARMLIATQTGPLRLFDGTSLLPDPVLDLSREVCNSDEDGLLGVAVDPSFAVNGYIYVYYTHAERGACFNRVSRFTMSGNTASAGSELVLVDEIPATGGYHNAGDLAFGRDGYLYVSVGDGGCDYAGDSGCGGANDASRDENALVGKILRITADGGIPPTNPFQGPGTARCNTGTVSPGLKCQETYARGLRNPFRIALDPNASGTRFFINDVGQNVWEEIDDAQAGADYGWNEREGPCANGSTTDCGPPPAGMTNPIFSYDHTDGCTSITGGAFVPDGVWPGYDGAYVYGDYVCGKLFVLTQSGGSYSSTEFTTGAGSPVDMRFGPDGSTQALYYTNYVNGGQVRRIEYTGTANRAPTAAISANPTAGAAPLAVSFDASASSDPDLGDTLTFRWDFGDGSPTVQTTAPTTSHTYTSTGSFTASVVAIDDHGAASQPATIRIDPGDTPPQPSIDAPAPDYTFGVGETITLRGSATDAEDGTLPGSSLTWTVIRHHNTHTHPFLAPTTGASVNIVGPEPEDVAAAANSYLEIFLTATDSRGLSKTVSMNLQPAKVDITLATDPASLALEVNGFTAPSSFVSWKNWAFSVNAPDQTDPTGKPWTFASWSDGGARSHTIVTPASAATYTATFTSFAAPTGLVAAYGFDDGSGASAADSSGNGNTGAVSGAAWATAGRYGSALSFNGTSSRVVVPDADSLDLTTALTVEAWVRPTALSAWRTIALKERSGGILYSLYANEAGNRPVGQVDIGGEHNALGSGVLPLDTWSHLAVTWDGTTLRLYVNGTQAGSTTVTGTLLDSSGPLDIGGNGVWGEYFSGLIDEVRVYNRALGDSEIQTDMDQPVGGGAPPADSQPPTAPTSLQPSVSGNTVTLTWGAATDNVAVRRYHVHRATSAGFAPTAANEIATTSATSYADAALAPDTYFYKVTAEDTSGNVGPPSSEVAAAVSAPPPSGNGLVAAYGFDEGNGTTTADASGNGNAGTLSGGAAWSTSGHSGNALSFNGSTGRVAVADADSLDLTTALTLEAWVRPSALSDWRTVVLKERSGGIVYSLYANNSGDRPVGQVDVGGEQNAAGTAKLPLDTWSHLAATWDGATLRLYVDGVESGSKAVSGSLVDTSGPLDIGANTVWGEHFAGLIDDVRVYNRALGASEVQADMTQPVGVAPPAADTQPPTPPTSLRSSVTGSSVALAWDAASDNVGIRRYHVHRATSSGFAPSAANEIGTASATTYTDTGLAADTYYYEVTAEDTSGNVGPASAETSASVESAPAASGLVASFGFDEGAGNATKDSSGNGTPGTLEGGVSWTSGNTGSALTFNGVDALVTVADAPSLELAGPLTLEAWVRPATVNASYRTVVLKERSGGLCYALYADTSAGGPSGHVYVGGSEPRARAAIPLAANTWTHLAMTYDSTTIRLYVNGSLAASTATTGSVTTSAGPLRIGGNSVWGEHFSGVIDDVRVYNRALSALEIGADMSRPA